MEGRLQVFTGNAHPALAEAICRELGVDLGRAIVSTFQNGETRVKLDENVRGADVFVIQPTSEPVNNYIMELLLMIDALRRASADRITAVIPYYGYAKQEKKTSGREPISAKLVANLITTAGADRVLTVDLHSPAIEGFFDIPVDHLRATPLLARAFRSRVQGEIVVVSPDAGGVGRAQDFRTRANGSLAIISKQHPDADKTEMLDIVGDVDGKTAVIVDDMISTGGTLVEAVKLLRARGAERIYVCATHGIFAGNALELIGSADIDELIVTDTILLPHEAPENVSVVSVAPLLAEAIMRTHKGMSISALFT
ncbi:MAG: ribose-phosphate pyrophosphokinase [Thermomicrobiales bacterium]|nr:ribose-phosphate pyrophosphokinase [Thermomicrobiales bacterium]MCO5218724.1 ribose-phosphate pyrophosphokinase [Thermomicrobiales bacterium]MCO5225751.1 ribose-phosphate pyrophosphokinase [Thermomicrobiales bacterium]MCO5228012.1 ribose-phosphate pyrophosphokinase [Thermomicrobiales bacterium]